ncbi:P-loop containing nucleoside triphosphate hydrolase protein [Cercophora samala]|uniref:P-loop containing nucleoside triphosphate hydrolase protein n=1 Tax=Cercophora samala TaxID=330535 RepID=A0AA39ZDK9_9PEZI|nr:P-loop containing nucleoside triphosphate hydrolase protein [Cercophora samala]
MVASFAWTAEEARYLKAVLRWQDAPSSDEDINITTKPVHPRRRAPLPPSTTPHQRKQPPYQHQQQQPQQQPQEKDDPPAGEFRVLVLGAKGAGKSSLLTRFSQNLFPLTPSSSRPTTTTNESHPGSCRHPIHLPSPTNKGSKTTTTTTTTTKYLIDALEFPSNQLSSNPLLEQALAITETAIILYDVTNPDSFRLARGVGEFIKEYFNPLTPSPNNSTNSGSNRRVYPVVLVANKCDTNHFQGDPARQVALEEGRAMAERIGVRYLEVSARTGEGVKGLFEGVGGEVLKVRGGVDVVREREGYERVVVGGKGVEVVNGEGGKGKGERGGLWRRMFWRRGGQQQ